MATLKDKKILLAVTGSIAAYKIATLTRLLVKSGAEVRIIMTEAATKFITPLTLATLSKNEVHQEVSSGASWNNHVELGLWADAMVVAPLTATSMAKMANAICDSMVVAVYLSARCPVFFAPAMDLDMYEHKTTKDNLTKLISNGNKIIEARTGELASGLVGKGRMEEPENILKQIKLYLKEGLLLSGKTVLITAGPTYEQIDPVRFIGNNSSGKMGYELAKTATKLGADVTLVSGPTELKPESNTNLINVRTAAEMYDAVHENFKTADIIIMAAAVADYSPKEIELNKIKKTNESFSINLVSTKDILSSIGKIKLDKQHICNTSK